MSNTILPRKPAYSALRPNSPEFVPLAEGKVRRALFASIGEGKLFGRKGVTDSLTGYYLHKNANITTFLKVVPTEHVARQAAANMVADWVARSGVCTSVLLPGFPKWLDEDHAAFAYPYISARFAEATITDLRKIGTGLALMHAALARLPDCAEIRQASAARVGMLKNRFNLIRLGACISGPQSDRLRKLFESEAAIFALLDGAMANQPLHGDLVYGNILFPLEGGVPVLLDFEDTLISWMPVDLDIALALERFALLPAKNEDEAFMLAREMLRSYAVGCGKVRFLTHALSDCLQLLAIRSLTTLAELEVAGGNTEGAEWNKFFLLQQHAVEKSGLLAMLENEFRA